MPQLGESVTEGTVLRWLKQPNDHVALDEPLVEVDTEKVNVEIPSPFAGKLTQIMVEEGQTVPVGAPLAEILSDGETAAAAPPATAAAPPQPQAPTPAPAAAAPSAPPEHPAPQTDQSRATPARGADTKRSPVVARLAAEHGIDPTTVRGSGAGGRVTKKDMLAAISEAASAERKPTGAPAAPTPTPVPIPDRTGALADVAVPETPMRRAIAEHMSRSRRTAAHAWLVMETDVTSLVAARAARKDEFREREGVDLTYLAFVAKAVARALHQFPRLNATYDSEKLFERRDVNLAFAVDVPERSGERGANEAGLVVPVVHQADRMSIAALAHAITDVANRARSGGLKLHEIQGGTFTIDNTGTFGTTMTAPIINQPQVAILTTEAIIKRPFVLTDPDGNDSLAIRSIMNLCLSFDHRALDGALAARFTARVKELLEATGPDTAIY